MMYLKQEKHKHGLFYALLTLLLVLCFLQSVLQVGIPGWMTLAVAALIALCGDQDEIMAMCISCVPLHNSFGITYAVMLGLGVYMLKYFKKLRFSAFIIPIFIMMLWEILHSFNQSFSVVQYLAPFVPMLMLAILVGSRDTKFDYSFQVRVCAIGTLAVGGMLILHLLMEAEFNLLEALAGLQRLGISSEESDSTVLVNPNSLGIVSVIAMTGLMQLRRMGQKNRSNTVMLAVLLVLGIMTSSRTFLVCLALMAAAFLLGQKSTMKKKVQYLASAAAAVLAALLVLNWVAPALLEYYLGRFGEGDMTTGRADLMSIYHEYIMTHNKVLFFGIGLQGLGHQLVDILQIAYNSPHFFIQEIILAWGLPGLAMFAALCYVMITRSRERCQRQTLINYIPLLIILAKSLAGQLITSRYTMLALSFAYLSLCTDMSPEGVAAMQDAAPEEKKRSILRYEVDFVHAVAALWKKKFVIAAVSVACAVGMYGVSATMMKPMYQTSTLMYVNNKNVSVGDVVDRISYADIWTSRSLVNTYSAILKSGRVLNHVAEQAGLTMSAEQLKERIRVSVQEDTEVLKVYVTHEDPATAIRIANTMADLAPTEIAGIIDGTSARVVDYAVKADMVSPTKTTNALLGFMFGALLVVMIVLLQAMTDTTIEKESEIAQAYAYPVLAMIPDLAAQETSGYKRPYDYHSTDREQGGGD